MGDRQAPEPPPAPPPRTTLLGMDTEKLADVFLDFDITSPAALEARLMIVDQLKDSLQSAFNNGAFLCPLAGKSKPALHTHYCQSCRVRALLTPGWYLKPEEAFVPNGYSVNTGAEPLSGDPKGDHPSRR